MLACVIIRKDGIIQIQRSFEINVDTQQDFEAGGVRVIASRKLQHFLTLVHLNRVNTLESCERHGLQSVRATACSKFNVPRRGHWASRLPWPHNN